MNTTSGRLQGKTAVITGGGRGIGRGIGVRFAREGARVALIENERASLANAVQEVTGAGGTALACEADVSDPAMVGQAIAECIAQFGKIDILVNNAGIAGYSGGFLELSYQTWQQVIGVNLSGMFLCGQLVAQHMVEHVVRGRIINVGSINSFAAERDAAAYVVSKGGVRSLTYAMAVDLAPHGILVNCLAPGPIIVERNTDLFYGPMSEAINRGVPLGRPGTVEETAAAAVFLASDEASYITGATLLVDGGTRAFLRFD